MSDTTKSRISGALTRLLTMKQDDLSVRQLAVGMACKKGPQTVRGLAERFDVSKPAITRAADRLTEKKLLVREADPEDGRSVFLNLTPAGESFFNCFE